MKLWEISLPAERLSASHEGLCCIELSVQYYPPPPSFLQIKIELYLFKKRLITQKIIIKYNCY